MPTAFISYSWDSEEHREWVRELGERLRRDAVEVSLDQWDLAPGDRLPRFMEDSIRKSDYVLIICTPRYREKADSRTGGVGYEEDVMTAEVFSRHNHRKFVPVLACGEWAKAAPRWLAGNYYIDLRGEPYSEEQYIDLLTTIHNVRRVAPPVGSVPERMFGGRPLKGETTSVEKVVEPIRIEGVLVDEVTAPKNDAAHGSALYKVPFKLSRSPSHLWGEAFVAAWDHPPRWTSMHRPGIASVVGDRIVLDGTTMEEVANVHRETLILAVQIANEQVERIEEKRREAAETEARRLREHEGKVKKLAEGIKFD